MKTKTFDCVEMKRASQIKIREKVRGMTRQEEVDFFRSGADEFEQRIRSARENRTRKNKAERRSRQPGTKDH